MFHLIGYGQSHDSTVLTNDNTAFTDPEFSQRNSHYLFSEQYYLIAQALFGDLLSEGNLLAPTFNAIGKLNISPLNGAKNVASPPRVDFFIRAPLQVPMNEEVQVQSVSTGADTTTYFGVLAIPNWSPKLPPGIPPVPMFSIKITFTPTFKTGNWSTIVPITFEQSLRGGTYSIVGAEFEGANLLAARVVFPQAFIYKNRRLRPGWIASNAIGDLTAVIGVQGSYFLGEWGQFTTAEPPQIEAAGLGSTTVSCQGILRLVRVSENIQINYAGQSYS